MTRTMATITSPRMLNLLEDQPLLAKNKFNVKKSKKEILQKCTKIIDIDGMMEFSFQIML